jgi:hypothetical protein
MGGGGGLSAESEGYVRGSRGRRKTERLNFKYPIEMIGSVQGTSALLSADK